MERAYDDVPLRMSLFLCSLTVIVVCLVFSTFFSSFRYDGDECDAARGQETHKEFITCSIHP